MGLILESTSLDGPSATALDGNGTPALLSQSYYIETYGCQMNVSDSEIVHSILQKSNLKCVDNPFEADILLINTCAIRESAEDRIWGRLGYFKHIAATSGRGVAKQRLAEIPVALIKPYTPTDDDPDAKIFASPAKAPAASATSVEATVDIAVGTTASSPSLSTTSHARIPNIHDFDGVKAKVFPKREGRERGEESRAVVGVLGCMAERLKVRRFCSFYLISMEIAVGMEMKMEMQMQL
jgi:hypothetical protein